MNIEVDIKADTRRRVAAIAKRTGLSESQIIAEALEQGHSLEWQERFADKVAAGIKAADSGEFASEADLERVRSKYRDA
ncbi:transcriptional regulator [Mesorhizobium sp. YIM 152430]|uniref:transcriptional regulator n=1 Tax=Mesorhizobium sp. YIM 152430 TaxID=3031761 RepID=UPI0023DA6E5D|nr:transcriptional regulator [Mesorhizobium sp. YIM 152430]MDF1598174.1 transcriptional regulator [Mesorhizobium sp. YIM 152430]